MSFYIAFFIFTTETGLDKVIKNKSCSIVLPPVVHSITLTKRWNGEKMYLHEFSWRPKILLNIMSLFEWNFIFQIIISHELFGKY